MKNRVYWCNGASKTIKNEVKEQKDWFFGMILDTLGARLLGNMLAVKGVIRGDDGVIRASEGVIGASQNFQFFLIL